MAARAQDMPQAPVDGVTQHLHTQPRGTHRASQDHHRRDRRVITGSLLAVTPADAAVDRTPARHRVFIVVAGDSIAHGDRAANGEGWSHVLQDECGATCRVKNVAMGSTCLVKPAWNELGIQ